jgi:hypothetical protein
MGEVPKRLLQKDGTLPCGVMKHLGLKLIYVERRKKSSCLMLG